MKNPMNILHLILMVGLLTSCGDMSKTVEEKLNELNNKAQHLDSLVNKEIDKVLVLDSLINMEGKKVKELDSIVRKSSSKIDSIANEKIKTLKKLME